MRRRVAIKRIIFAVMTVFAGGGMFFYLKRNDKSITELLDHIGLITALSEIIIPTTHTPGASEAGISNRIIALIQNCLSDRDRRTVMSGLYDLEAYTMQRYKLYFTECTASQRFETVVRFQNKGTFENEFLNKLKNKIMGQSFFELIKNLTVRAYCTSYIGATQGLAYDHIPENFVPCTSILPGQLCWATS